MESVYRKEILITSSFESLDLVTEYTNIPLMLEIVKNPLILLLMLNHIIKWKNVRVVLDMNEF